MSNWSSIWPADIACLRSVLLEALEELSVRLILVPHEPNEEHVSEIKEIFSSIQFIFGVGSKEEFAKARVLIVDAIEFSSLYAKANLPSWVGPSLLEYITLWSQQHLDYNIFWTTLSQLCDSNSFC